LYTPGNVFKHTDGNLYFIVNDGRGYMLANLTDPASYRSTELIGTMISSLKERMQKRDDFTWVASSPKQAFAPLPF